MIALHNDAFRRSYDVLQKVIHDPIYRSRLIYAASALGLVIGGVMELRDSWAYGLFGIALGIVIIAYSARSLRSLDQEAERKAIKNAIQRLK